MSPEDSGPTPLDVSKRSSWNTWWAARFIDKFLLPLGVVFTAGVVASAIGTWVAVQQLSQSTNRHEAKIASLEAAMVSKAEMLETMKRMEQQMEIIMLRSQLNEPKR